jgi:Ca-activated chloride channel family protein
MNGQPIAQGKKAIVRGLELLTPNDTFQVIRFSSNSSTFGAEPVLATEENVRKAIEYVQTLQGQGGTQMIEGIKAALDFPHDAQRFRLVSFMTDGFIGNEQEILAAVYEKLGDSRIFSFGVGSSPNRYLLDRMAMMGKGAVAYMSLNDDPQEVVDRFYSRIAHPAMTDLAIDFGSMQVQDIYPQYLPDLLVGRPIVLTGRFEGTLPSSLRVIGNVQGKQVEMEIPVNTDTVEGHPGVALVWARKKIEMLKSRQTVESNAELPPAIQNLALQYSLMSDYTAFVAVDSLVKTAGDCGCPVEQAVPVPEGVNYETTVEETSSGGEILIPLG